MSVITIEKAIANDSLNLQNASAEEISSWVKSRSISASEVIQFYLNTISELDGDLPSLDNHTMAPTGVHSFISLTAERAIREAEQIDKEVKEGSEVGPLAGVPFSVKDIFCVSGTLSSAGSRILANYTAPYTATIVRRLVEAGAIIVGKTNCDEFTFGSSTESSAFQPTTRNPWDFDKVPGGSSGGSAASVAAGEAIFSLGSDTAGSIRQPSAFCSVVGLKPSYGLVSRYGLIAFSSSMDCPGPISRNVRDSALILGTIAGPDPYDATAVDLGRQDYLNEIDSGVKNMRIGISPDFFLINHRDPFTNELVQETINPEIKKRVLHAIEIFRDMGAEIIEDVPMPHIRHGVAAYIPISRVEAASNLQRFDPIKYGYRKAGIQLDVEELYSASRGEGFGIQPKLRISLGVFMSAERYSGSYYERAQKIRALIKADFDNAFSNDGEYRLDALLTPTTPTVAFNFGDIYGDSVLMQYADQLTVPVNHAGLPAISIPSGFSDQGLPIGIQLVADRFMEKKLLRIARAYELGSGHEEWRARTPQTNPAKAKPGKRL